MGFSNLPTKYTESEKNTVYDHAGESTTEVVYQMN